MPQHPPRHHRQIPACKCTIILAQHMKCACSSNQRQHLCRTEWRQTHVCGSGRQVHLPHTHTCLAFFVAVGFLGAFRRGALTTFFISGCASSISALATCWPESARHIRSFSTFSCRYSSAGITNITSPPAVKTGSTSAFQVPAASQLLRHQPS